MHNDDAGAPAEQSRSTPTSHSQHLTPHSHPRTHTSAAARGGALLPHNNNSHSPSHSPDPSELDRFSTPELVSPPTSSPRRNDRSPGARPSAASSGPATSAGGSARAGQNSISTSNPRAFQRYRSPPQRQEEAQEREQEEEEESWDDFDTAGSKGDDKARLLGDADADDADMPSDLRSSLDRWHDGKSQEPLLSSKDGERHPGYDSPPRPALSRRSTAKFYERDPDLEAKKATRKRYTYAGFFLVLSLVSFAVQTETAVYIQSKLHWEKAYCML